MGTSIIQKSDNAFTDLTLPTLSRDALVGRGTLFRLDFTNAYTLNGAPHGAVLADGVTLKNLVEGSVDATTVATSAAAVAADGKGLVVTASGNNPANYIGFPNGAFDMHDAGDHSFIVHLWAALDETGQSNNASWFGARSGSTNAADVSSPIWGATAGLFMMFNNTDGRTATAYTRAYGVVNSINLPSGGFKGANAQLVSFASGVEGASIFKNGEFVAAASAPGASLPSTRSHATLTASTNVSDGDAVTVNGTVITFVTSGASGAQVNIGTDAAASLVNLRTYINANSSTLNARAERTNGQAATVLTVLHTGTGTLTLTESSATLAVSSITNPYAIRLFHRGLKGKIYAVGMEDLTVSGRTPAQAAAHEYELYRAYLTAIGV